MHTAAMDGTTKVFLISCLYPAALQTALWFSTHISPAYTAMLYRSSFVASSRTMATTVCTTNAMPALIIGWFTFPSPCRTELFRDASA